MLRLTKQQLRGIIKEETTRLQKRPIVVTRTMLRRMISESVEDDVLATIAQNDLYIPDEEFQLPSPIPMGYWAWQDADNMNVALMRGTAFVTFVNDPSDLPGDCDEVYTLADGPMPSEQFLEWLGLV